MLEIVEMKDITACEDDCPWDRTLIMASEPDERGFRIGLFFVEQSPDQWVTWMIHPEGETFWGHYCQTRRRGIEDYLARCEKEGVEA